VRGDLVPQLTIGTIGDRGVVLVGVGLELDYAQKEQGLRG